MRSIKKETLSQQVGDGIKKWIEQEGLKPGDKLPTEKAFIAHFGVSRTVVREALKSLERIGLVQLRAGDGIYVDSPSMTELTNHISFQWQRNARTMKELLQVRRALELTAIELAIARVDADESILLELEQWIAAMEVKLSQHAMPMEEDYQFHRALFKATGNEILYQLSDFLHSFFENMSQEQQKANIRHIPISLEEHKQLVSAIRAKDVPLAQAVMHKHLLPLEIAWKGASSSDL